MLNAKVTPTRYAALEASVKLTSKSHDNPEEVFELYLRDVVADILIVHQVAIRVRGFVDSDAFGDVRLEKEKRQWSSRQYNFKAITLTTWTPFRSLCMNPASVHP